MKIMARSQSEPGSQASPEALSDLRPAGVDPSRMQWQPIATAPTDGTLIILGFWDTDDAGDLDWFTPEGWFTADEVPQVWRVAVFGDIVHPTHWLPRLRLPPPPPQGMEARSAETSGSARKGDSPVGRQSDAPIPSPTPEP